MKRVTRSSLGLSIVPIIVMIGVGTVAYAFLEGWSLPDALYATIITITTVGYGDFSPRTLGGRLFAIFFTLSAIGLASYAISNLAAVVIRWEHDRVHRQIQEERMAVIASLSNHIIVCGASPISRKAMYFFQRDHQPMILVEQNVRAALSLTKRALVLVGGRAVIHQVAVDLGTEVEGLG